MREILGQEPEYTDLPYGTFPTDDEGKRAADWARWARKRLERVEKELAEAQSSNAVLKRTVAARDGQVTALTEVIRQRSRGPETYDLGSEVMIDASGNKGKVTAIFIDRGGVKYYVCWWHEGRRYEERLDHGEVTLMEDILPPRAE